MLVLLCSFREKFIWLGYSSAHNSSQLAEYVAATPGQSDPVSLAVLSHYNDFVSIAFNFRLSRTAMYYISTQDFADTPSSTVYTYYWT